MIRSDKFDISAEEYSATTEGHCSEDFFYEGIETIDRKFGAGYSKEHPELLAAYMKMRSDELNCYLTLGVIQNSVFDIVKAINYIGVE